jgi:hypothetical protein
LIYLTQGTYSGSADVMGALAACDAVSAGSTTDPITGTVQDCGAYGFAMQATGISASGFNVGGQSQGAQGLLNIGHRSTVGNSGFSNNGFLQDSLNVGSLGTISLAKHTSSTTEKHIGAVGTGSGADVNIGAVSGIGLTRTRLAAYTGSAAHVFDNGSSSSTPLWRGLNNGTQNSVLFAEGQLLITGLSTAISTKTTTYTVTSFDHTILADASGGAFTVNLPAAANLTGWEFVILKKDSSGNSVTVDANGSETINGATTQVLSTQYQKVRIKSDGTEWFIV